MKFGGRAQKSLGCIAPNAHRGDGPVSRCWRRGAGCERQQHIVVDTGLYLQIREKVPSGWLQTFHCVAAVAVNDCASAWASNAK